MCTLLFKPLCPNNIIDTRLRGSHGEVLLGLAEDLAALREEEALERAVLLEQPVTLLDTKAQW